MQKINEEMFSEELLESELTDLSKIIGGMADPGTKKADDCNTSDTEKDCDSKYSNDSDEEHDTVKDTDSCNPA